MKYFRLTFCLLLVASLVNASYVNPPFPIAKGGTGTSSQTASRAVITDGSGNVVSTGSTTSTEIGFVNGVTSSIQTQFTGKASTTLNNLGTTSINSDILPSSSGSKNVGSSSLLWNNAFLTLLKDASSVTSVDPIGRALYNSSGTKVLDYSGSQVTEFLSVVNGGNASYSINASDGHIRSGTALTVDRTYTLDVCNASNIGERHEVKNLPSQTHNIIVAANGSDLIDGSASFTLLPGDALSVICAAFSSVGTWDIE